MSITHTIYFARHGESAANLTHITTPHDEDVLTEKGKIQAELLGKYLRDEKIFFTKAYSSIYPRAADSAKLILAANNDGLRNAVKLVEDHRIREKEFGDLMGKPAMDAYYIVEAAYKKGTPLLQVELPGAELASKFEERLDSALDDIFRDLSASPNPETVLIVSHGICMFRILGKLRSRTTAPVALDEFKEASYKPMPNTGYHLLEVSFPKTTTDGTHDIRKINLEFKGYHQKPHLGSLEQKQVGEQKSDLLKMAKTLKLDLEMLSECAMQ